MDRINWTRSGQGKNWRIFPPSGSLLTKLARLPTLVFPSFRIRTIASGISARSGKYRTNFRLNLVETLDKRCEKEREIDTTVNILCIYIFFSRAGVQGGQDRGGGGVEGRVVEHRVQSGGRSSGAQFPMEIQQQRGDAGSSAGQILDGDVERRERVQVHADHRAGLRHSVVLGGQFGRQTSETVSLPADSGR